jgi:hypothetical protein
LHRGSHNSKFRSLEYSAWEITAVYSEAEAKTITLSENSEVLLLLSRGYMLLLLCFKGFNDFYTKRVKIKQNMFSVHVKRLLNKMVKEQACCLLGYNAMQSDRITLALFRIVLLPSYIGLSSLYDLVVEYCLYLALLIT